jgi:ribosomal protein S18 acetylase RimI-like enzyme
MEIRAFRKEDGAALAALAAECARGETDFVLNPYWETVDEMHAEFARFGIAPEEHVLVADAGEGEVVGLVGFLRHPGAREAGIFCPIVKRGERGHGVGGDLLRAAQRHGVEKLGIRLVTAGIGTRNRAGYALLTSHGFRPVRQAFLMRCSERPEDRAPPIEDLALETAREDDADPIHALYEACGFPARTAEAMRETLSDGRHVHVVARHEDRLVAFAEIETHWPQRVWVAFVGVTPEIRDRGVGSHVVSWALAHQFDAGAVSGQLMLSPANRTALRAYEKVGFRRFRLIDVLEKSL